MGFEKARTHGAANIADMWGHYAARAIGGLIWPPRSTANSPSCRICGVFGGTASYVATAQHGRQSVLPRCADPVIFEPWRPRRKEAKRLMARCSTGDQSPSVVPIAFGVAGFQGPFQ